LTAYRTLVASSGAAVLLALAALAALLGLLTFAPSASAIHVQCGDVITEDTRLDSDLDCSQVTDPPGCRGLVVFGDRPITLDLGGHTITGPGRDACAPYVPEGISVQAVGATVMNGTVQRFDTGISAFDGAEEFRNLVFRESHEAIYGSARRIVNNLLDDNRHGMNLYPAEGPGAVTVARNIVNNTTWGSGISITGPEDVVLDGNRVSNAGGWGIHLRPWTYWVPSHYVTDNGNYVVSRNRADGNAGDGIYVEVPSTTVTQNRAFFNGDLGIEAVTGVTDGGKNRARNNGNPAQCVGVQCR
jgi:parallel beta-helix repeat protein